MGKIREPIIIRPSKVDKSKQAHLFSIIEEDPKGREVEKKFFVRTEISPADSLKAMHIGRTQGEQALEMFGMEIALGKEGYAALMECEGLEWEHLEAISTYAAELLGGKGKGPAGNRNRDSRRASKKSSGSRRAPRT